MRHLRILKRQWIFLSLSIDAAYYGNYIPLPGSADFDTLITNGELKLDQIRWENYNSYVGVLPYHPRGISEQELRKAIKAASLRFYLRPRIILGLLRRLKHPVFWRSFMNRLIGVLFRQ